MRSAIAARPASRGTCCKRSTSALRAGFSSRERAGMAGIPRPIREPEQTAGHFRFEGNHLIGTRTLIGGAAAQMVVSFDPGFQSCTASVHFGRESGKPFQYRGLRGELFTATGVPTASTPTCSVREGNAFAQ